MSIEIKEEFKEVIKSLTIEISKNIVIQEFKEINKNLDETRKKYEETNIKYERILKEINVKIEKIAALEKSLVEIKNSLNMANEREKLLIEKLEEKKQNDKVNLGIEVNNRKISSENINDKVGLSEKNIVLSESQKENKIQNKKSLIEIEVIEYEKRLNEKIIEYKKGKLMIKGKFSYINRVEIKTGLVNERIQSLKLRIKVDETGYKNLRVASEYREVAESFRNLTQDIKKTNYEFYMTIKSEENDIYNNLIILSKCMDKNYEK